MSLPIPNLDDKRFSDLVEEAKKRVPIYAPEWTDHNVHDPGITLIELFAWLAEMQLYRLNTITEKNKLKFLKLLGVKPKPATAAKADVTFTLNTNSVLVPARTKVAAKDTETGDGIIFETDRDIRVVPVKLARIISQGMAEIRDCTEANKLDGHFYRAFGESAEEGSILYLGFDQPFPANEKIDLMVYLYESDLIERGKHGDEEPVIIPSAEVRWEYSMTESTGCKWVDLEIVGDETLALLCSGTISFRTPEDMAKCTVPPFDDERYGIRCRVVKSGYEIPPRIDAIRLNTVRVEQGETVEAEIIGSGTGLPNQTFFLQHKPILAGSQEIAINDESWTEVDDFDASGLEDPHYVIDYDTGEILFGDGVHGDIPSGDNIKAKKYRFGGGEKGNVKAGAISKIPNFDKLKVVNDQAASGGAEEETLEEAIIRARKDLKERYRAVTSQDYEYIAKATPGLRVKRAKAIPEEGSVTVVVVPESTLDKPVPSDGFLMTVCLHLDKHRLITTGIHVKAPDYVKVSVNAEVKMKGGYESDKVRQRLEKALKTFLHPLTGGPEGEGWPFGRSVYKSEINELIEDVEGVDCVQKLNMMKEEYSYDGEEINIPDSGLVYSGKHSIRIIVPEEECRVEGGFL
nr:conserved hypothetical protein [uncultured archaeon]